MDDEVIVTGCYHCGDYFITNDLKGNNIYNEYANRIDLWWSSPKECLSCHKMYHPFVRRMWMDRFIFEAFRTVKM